MRQRMFTSAIVAATLLAASASAPEATWPITQHSFGIINEADGIVPTRFAMVNTGDAPLRILSARANCGCTDLQVPKGAVEPGDTAWIDVSYDPAGRPGRFNKKIYIDTNTEPRRSTLVISGTVIGSPSTIKGRYPIALGPIALRDRFAIFGDVSPYESVGRYIEAYNCSADTLRPRVADVPRGLSVVLQPEIVPPGEQFIFSIVLRANKEGQWGLHNIPVTVTPDAGSPLSMAIECTYNVKDDFRRLTPEQLAKAPVASLSAHKVDTGRTRRGDGTDVTAEVRLTNNGESKLNIRRIYCPDGSPVEIKAGQMSIKKGKSTKIAITIPSSMLADADMINETIELITDDPVHPVQQIRIVGELTD